MKNKPVIGPLLAGFAIALLSAPGAAQDTGMPTACAQGELQRCSLQVWARDSFPRAGVTQSVTFSNGLTLTCTSTGHDKPRDCQLSRSIEESQQVEQCSHMKDRLRALTLAQTSLAWSGGDEWRDLNKAVNMEPDMLNREIADLQDLIAARDKGPPSSYVARQRYMEKQRLNFLLDLRANQALGPEMGVSTAKMRARADRIISDQRASDDVLRRANDREIRSVQDQISSLGCDQVPTVNQ
jgi:hypothetical protein